MLYDCCYCEGPFYLVDPEDFTAGGCIRLVQYRNKKTNEIGAVENREINSSVSD